MAAGNSGYGVAEGEMDNGLMFGVSEVTSGNQ